MNITDPRFYTVIDGAVWDCRGDGLIDPAVHKVKIRKPIISYTSDEVELGELVARANAYAHQQTQLPTP